MNGEVWIGATLAVIGGAMQGAFALPMKYARKWQHENIWLVFAVSGFVALPWILTSLTIPHWLQIYRSSPATPLAIIILCGLGWGIGATLVGIAFRLLGIGLAFAIILGLSSLFGSLIPFVFQSRETISSTQGILYLASTAVMLVGIVLVSAAGSIRDRDMVVNSTGGRIHRRFLSGLIVAIIAGLFSSLLSDGIAFTQPLADAAQQAGASPVWASNIVLALLTASGAVANVAYCAYKLRRNRSGALYFAESVANHWALGIFMGALWYGGLMLYSLGEQRVGTVTGWTLFIGAMILSSNASGFATGEWKGAQARSKVFLGIGSLIIFAALIITGTAQKG